MFFRNFPNKKHGTAINVVRTKIIINMRIKSKIPKVPKYLKNCTRAEIKLQIKHKISRFFNFSNCTSYKSPQIFKQVFIGFVFLHR